VSTSAEIESAWTAAIWTHADILSLTDKIHLYEVTTESEKENALLYSGTKVNFFEVLTGRGQNYNESSSRLGQTIQYNYLVEINYYRELDTTGENFRAIRDAFETLLGLVISELGDNWDSTVEFWKPDNAIPRIAEVLINNKKCWKGTTQYTAVKQTIL
jgi:hypothetical protein